MSRRLGSASPRARSPDRGRRRHPPGTGRGAAGALPHATGRPSGGPGPAPARVRTAPGCPHPGRRRTSGGSPSDPWSTRQVPGARCRPFPAAISGGVASRRRGTLAAHRRGVAQLARAPVSKTGCRRFDSCHPCQGRAGAGSSNRSAPAACLQAAALLDEHRDRWRSSAALRSTNPSTGVDRLLPCRESCCTRTGPLQRPTACAGPPSAARLGMPPGTVSGRSRPSGGAPISPRARHLGERERPESVGPAHDAFSGDRGGAIRVSRPSPPGHRTSGGGSKKSISVACGFRRCLYAFEIGRAHV